MSGARLEPCLLVVVELAVLEVYEVRQAEVDFAADGEAEVKAAGRLANAGHDGNRGRDFGAGEATADMAPDSGRDTLTGQRIVQCTRTRGRRTSSIAPICACTSQSGHEGSELCAGESSRPCRQ